MPEQEPLPDWRVKQKREHYEKYEALAQRIGIDKLVAVLEAMPLSPATVQRALDSGDEHLNSIPLRKWDEAVGYWEPSWVRPKMEACPCCGHKTPVGFDERAFVRLKPFQDGPHSASERVCVLKHVARYHFAGGEA
jgi:hypothetical protein